MDLSPRRKVRQEHAAPFGMTGVIMEQRGGKWLALSCRPSIMSPRMTENRKRGLTPRSFRKRGLTPRSFVADL